MHTAFLVFSVHTMNLERARRRVGACCSAQMCMLLMYFHRYCIPYTALLYSQVQGRLAITQRAKLGLLYW